MLDVNVRGVLMSGVAWVVLLDSREDDRTLPIAIGTAEAQAILFELNGVEFPRPLTHDLFRDVLRELGVTVSRVEITELRDATFFARLCLTGPAGVIEVDARPSDALALAVRCSAPVCVGEEVMAAAGIIVPDTAAGDVEITAGETPPTGSDPLAELSSQLATAVSEERYEDAAALRDKIGQLGCIGRPGGSGAVSAENAEELP